MNPGCTARLVLFVVAMLAATSVRGGGALELLELVAAQETPTYTLRRTIDIGASSAAGFSAFDPVSGRAYAATPDGLFRFDMETFERGERVSDLRFTGRLEFALDIGVLIAGLDGNRLAVLDATSYEMVRTIDHAPWSSFVYEPDTEELYLFSLDRSAIDVIDPRTGKAVTAIRLPSWGAGGGIRVPGRSSVYPCRMGLVG